MCVALKYVVDGKTRIAAAGVDGTKVPLLTRSGQVKWVEWGAPGEHHMTSPDAPGYFLKLPEGHWVDLTTLRAGAWWQYKPRPVKIAAIAFGVFLELEQWIPLKPGQYLQAALATVFAEQRVYIVTVTPPAEYSRARPCWPRII
jgi:hypothetical protein